MERGKVRFDKQRKRTQNTQIDSAEQQMEREKVPLNNPDKEKLTCLVVLQALAPRHCCSFTYLHGFAQAVGVVGRRRVHESEHRRLQLAAEL